MDSIPNLPNDVIIVSADSEVIQANKYLLSLFSPPLHSLLSTVYCTTPTIFLPDCSTISIQYLIDILSGGHVLAENISLEEAKNIEEVAVILNSEAYPRKNQTDSSQSNS